MDDFDDFRTAYAAACEAGEGEESPVFLLTPPMMRAILSPLHRYRDALVNELGLSGPNASLEELGKFPRTESGSERELECVRDLIKGNQVCQQINLPIEIRFV